jgi:hypothetical protein
MILSKYVGPHRRSKWVRAVASVMQAADLAWGRAVLAAAPMRGVHGGRDSLGAEQRLQRRDGLRKRVSSAAMRIHSWCAVGFGACCKCVFHVFQMFQNYAAIVSCGCCESGSRCFNIVGCCRCVLNV